MKKPLRPALDGPRLVTGIEEIGKAFPGGHLKTRGQILNLPLEFIRKKAINARRWCARQIFNMAISYPKELWYYSVVLCHLGRS
jgi:hypothetical protein